MDTIINSFTKRPGRKTFGVSLVSLAMLLVLLIGVVQAEDLPTITTDKADYVPGETVWITGTFWQPGESVDIFVNDDAGQSWSHSSDPDPVADDSGSFTYSFQLPNWFVANYSVTATGSSGSIATTTFTDANIGTYDQCANDDGDGYDANPGTCDWINGNLQSNNSTFNEGDATVQRLWLTDGLPGSTHTVTFKYGTTKGGKHAYDYLTTWDWSENWITLDDLCKDPQGPGLIDGCTTASRMQYQIPDDSNVPNSIEPVGPVGRMMTIAGGTITTISAPQIVSGDYTGDSETVITVSYTVGPNTGSMCSTKQGVTTCDVAIWFGAHIAMTAQWMAYNGTTGAVTISGSPYHVALDATDGTAVGQRDNQMQSGAVPLNGTIVIVKDAVPDDAQDFNFNLTNGSTFNQNFSLDDDANPALLNSRSFSLPAGTYTASELFPLVEGWTYTNLSCTVAGTNGSSYSVDLENAEATIILKTGFDTSDTVTCTYTDTMALYLTISKNANTSLTRTHTWAINKEADGEYWKFIGDPATTHSYTVSVDKTTTDSGWAASGNITIANNTGRAAVITGVSDTISPAIAATVSCGVSFPYTLAAGGTLNCTYSASLPNTDTRTNTVTVTTDGTNYVQGGTATAEVNFTSPTVTPVGHDSVNVTDTNGGSWGPVSADTTFPSYTKDFSCPTDPAAYTDGVYNAPDAVNTAKITETGLTDTATVKLHCYAPVPSKSADASFTRTYTWDITKDYDGSYDLKAGETVTHGYLVKVTKTTTDSGFVVSGVITVVNPNPQTAMTVSLADSVDGTAATLDCGGTLTVPAGGSATCGYSATLGSATNGTNTATVTLNSIDFTATKDYTFVTNVVGYNEINVTDTNGQSWGPVSGSTSWPYTKDYTCPSDPSLYTNGVYNMLAHVNTAKITETGQSDDATVNVTCHLPALQVEKTAQGEWDRTVTWTLSKSVDDDSHSGFAGDSFDSIWTVVADKTDSGPQNYRVTGTIKISNLAAIPQDFTLSDKLADGTVADVDCDPLADGNQAFGTVPAGGYVECTYKALPADDGAKENTVTVSATGNADQSFTAAVPWKENLTGYDSGLLEDTHLGISETISGDTTKNVPEEFSCSTDASKYSNGSYSYEVPNTATLDSGIGLTASAKVTVDCTLQPLVPSKTAAGEWDRTVTWTLEKSVDPASRSGFAGASFDLTWEVVLTKNDTGPLNYYVSGEISIYNPAAIAQSFTVADTLDDDTPVTVSCPATTVDPGATVKCTYKAFPVDDSATLNTATVSATGNADQIAKADVPWKENLTGSDSGDLTDPRFTYDENVSGSTTVTFDETFTCSTDFSRYTNGSYTEDFTNDAYFKNVDHNLHADASIGITCYWPASAEVVKNTTEGAEDIGQFPFTFKLYNPSGTLVDTKTLGAAGEVSFATEIKTAGTWKIVEVLTDGWVSQDDSLTCSFTVSFWEDAGKTFTCTFNNKEMGRVSVYKLTKGPGDPEPWIDTSKDWVFNIYNGPDGFGGTELASDSTLDDEDGLLDFGLLNLDPGKTYTICELNIPSGWTAEWKIDADGDGVPDQVVIPYNPNADENPSQDLGNRCFDFGAGTSYAVPVGDTLAFQVINEFPGGAPRTPGYWKNWNRCTGGGQATNADRQGGYENGFWLLEDVLDPTIGDGGIVWDDIRDFSTDPSPLPDYFDDEGYFHITECEVAVDILDQRETGDSSIPHDGPKHASDAAYTLAMHLLAAQLNFGASACTTQDVLDWARDAEELLDKYNFNGTGDYLRPKEADYNYALELAGYLDAYNNSLLCTGEPSPPDPGSVPIDGNHKVYLPMITR